jgi:hypothetical protein
LPTIKRTEYVKEQLPAVLMYLLMQLDPQTQSTAQHKPTHIFNYVNSDHDFMVLTGEALSIAQVEDSFTAVWWFNDMYDVIPVGITEAAGMAAVIAVFWQLFDWHWHVESLVQEALEIAECKDQDRVLEIGHSQKKTWSSTFWYLVAIPLSSYFGTAIMAFQCICVVAQKAFCRHC